MTPSPKLGARPSLLERVEWRATGGHPDHGSPDPIFREIFDYMVLEETRLRDKMLAYRTFLSHQAKLEILHRLADVPSEVAKDLDCLPIDTTDL